MTEDFSTGGPSGLVLCTQLPQFVGFLFFSVSVPKKKKKEKKKVKY